jgi:hypothetical protein
MKKEERWEGKRRRERKGKEKKGKQSHKTSGLS